MPRFPLLFAVLCFPLIVGCDGCRTDTAANPDQDSELSSEDFVAGRPMPYPPMRKSPHQESSPDIGSLLFSL